MDSDLTNFLKDFACLLNEHCATIHIHEGTLHVKTLDGSIDLNTSSIGVVGMAHINYLRDQEDYQ